MPFLVVVNIWVQNADAASFKILALGDSLSAGYGLPNEDSFTTQLERKLRESGRDITVLNAGVSGDTSKGGLARLNWALVDNPDMVIVELGANDGLRALDPKNTKENLDQILARLTQKNIKVLLAGMQAPPNLGREYVTEFNAIYPDLAQKHNVALYPFFLEGVAGIAHLNQDDAIHPNAEGVDVIVERMAPYILKVID